MSRTTSSPRPHTATTRKPRSYYGIALAGTAVLALFATGGLVSAAPQPAHHLMALAAPAKSALSPGAPPDADAPVLTPPKPRPGPAPRATTTTTTTSTPTTTTTTFVLPRVVSVNPRNGTHNVAPDQQLVVQLSSRPAFNAPMPTLSPAVQGVWDESGRTLRFTPLVGYIPWSTEVLGVPNGLAHPMSSHFNVAGVGTARAEQLLAELKYIPLRFGPTKLTTSLPLEAKFADLVSPFPQPGVFTWRYPDIPPQLAAVWSPKQPNVILQGAIMTFEDQHNLNVDGLMGPQVWQALSAAVAARQADPAPYDYLMVSETLPEDLVVWRDGQDLYQTPANTGVDGANTPVGTWPVYARYQTTTMTGTDVDGYHYVVPDVPWVAYFYGGDAVHGYWRDSYGWPQSNGCVELPVPNAQVVWGEDPIGTLVAVSS
ncbi:MAG TPA: L,D-transpeptidase family protein [Acidimicrobiales bacterium]|nr:L,D-transpeptidase family protein [Acidimicrobiales bacterium]